MKDMHVCTDVLMLCNKVHEVSLKFTGNQKQLYFKGVYQSDFNKFHKIYQYFYFFS